MSKRNKQDATYVVSIVSPRGSERIDTLEIRDNATGRNIDFATEMPALAHFGGKADMLESLSWCLNCWADKTVVSWMAGKDASHGIVYLYA